MKHFIFAMLSVTTLSASAQLGESISALKEAYGEPTNIWENIRGLEDHEFKIPGLEITAAEIDGKIEKKTSTSIRWRKRTISIFSC